MATRILNKPHPDVVTLHEMLNKLRDLHMEMNQKLMEVHEAIPKNRYAADQDLVDLGFISRASKDLLEDWRKVAHKAEERAGFQLGWRVTQASLQNPEVDTTVHGTLAYANTDIEYIPQLPDRSSKEYIDLMVDLGVPREIAEREGKFIKLDFKRIQTYLCGLAEDGKPIPPWVKAMSPNYTSTFVKKRTSSKVE
jgi:hypothetical protein